MKYICLSCKQEFNEEYINIRTESILVNSLIISCPYCDNMEIDLTKHGKLQVDRRAKINKIKNAKK